VLVLGGARSGKSVTAEGLLADRELVDYVACGAAFDDSDPAWAARVRVHRERRPASWTTLETLGLDGVLADRELAAARLRVPVLVDCLSTWLAGVMDECGLWTLPDGPDGEADTAAADTADKALADRVDALVEAWRSTSRLVVAVSNEVGLGVVPGTAAGVRYRDELGRLNARVAAESEQVWLCVAGLARRLK
jgi:adenosylcobinamide kinase/adenosylcobinamide-phosphate guanylyltransferase